MSFTVEKHFCGGHLIDVAIFYNVKKCDSEMPSSSNVTNNKPCCKDEVTLVEGQDELKLDVFEKPDYSTIIVLLAPSFNYVNLFESLPKQIIPFKDYSPPNLVYDLHILDQVFLI